MSTPCIDIHSHFFPRNAPDFARKFGARSGPWVTLHDHGDGTGMMMLGDKPFRPVHSALWDTAARLAEMDASHVETQIICATPVMFAYDAPAVEAAHVAASYNDLAREFCAPSGGRIRASLCAGSLPTAVSSSTGDSLHRQMSRMHSRQARARMP